MAKSTGVRVSGGERTLEQSEKEKCNAVSRHGRSFAYLSIEMETLTLSEA